MKQLTALFIFCLLCLSPVGAQAQETLRVLGTGENQEALRALAKGFEAKHPGLTIEVPDSIGSGGGIKALQKGKTDLARTGRPLKDSEKPGLTEVLFGKTAVVFATHPSVTGVTNLTVAQIGGIYTGAITNWKEVGGPDAKIYPTSREVGDSARIILDGSMPGWKDLSLISKEFFSSPEAVQAIEDNEFTIGYVSMASANGHALNFLRIDGKDPFPKSNGTIDYPYLVPFYLVHTDTLSPLAKQFIDFTHSTEGSSILLSKGTISTK